MKVLKPIKTYGVWTLMALLLGMLYMQLLLGNLPTDESYAGFGVILKVFYTFGLVYIGLPLGGLIAVLFIVTDILYLKRKLKADSKTTFIRLAVLITIAIVVGSSHYILEKVIDVI